MHWIAKWMRMTTDQVLDKFASVPSAFSDGIGSERFVWIPGQRDDRCLVVVHADTYWTAIEEGSENHVRIGQEKDMLFSKERDIKISWGNGRNSVGMGIGADDRAGCGIAFKNIDLGHSILVTSGEEIGQIAAKKLMRKKFWAETLNKHQYAIQFDRRNYNDIVFYDVGTKSFAEYIQKNTGFVPAKGTMTDIRHICKDICGVNISVGYYNEHTVDEVLVLDQFENSLRVVRELLSKKDIPKFPLNKTDLFDLEQPKPPPLPRQQCHRRKHKDSRTVEILPDALLVDHRISHKAFVPQHLLCCPTCHKIITQELWLNLSFFCPYCKNLI